MTLFNVILLSTWNFAGKNTGVGYHFLPQGNLPEPTQGLNLGLLHFRGSSALQADSLPAEPRGNP